MDFLSENIATNPVTTYKDLPEAEKRLLTKAFWRQYYGFLAFSMARMMTVGFVLVMLPWLKYLYPDKGPRYVEAMQRHKPFYNVTPDLNGFIIGLVMSMEKEYALDPEHFDPASISAIKVALMGPLSGIGDAIFWVTVRTIAASVAIGMAEAGSSLAPFVFLILYHIPSTLMRFFGIRYGYLLGNQFIRTAFESGAISMLTKSATSVGLIMVGAMTANFVRLDVTPVLSGEGASAQTLQAALNGIFPGLLPMLLTLVTLYFLKKGVNPSLIIVAYILIGIVGRLVGIV
jgi:PTS system mannose-specific IID component